MKQFVHLFAAAARCDAAAAGCPAAAPSPLLVETLLPPTYTHIAPAACWRQPRAAVCGCHGLTALLHPWNPRYAKPCVASWAYLSTVTAHLLLVGHCHVQQRAAVVVCSIHRAAALQQPRQRSGIAIPAVAHSCARLCRVVCDQLSDSPGFFSKRSSEYAVLELRETTTHTCRYTHSMSGKRRACSP